MKKTSIFRFEEIKPFEFTVNYAEITEESPHNTLYSHFHEDCEIYINISGDVSFVVEGNIYPINPGDIIITRPFEYHHCVYHSSKIHKHFCISFSPAGNEGLFDLFFKRKSGGSNRICPSSENSKILCELCHAILDKEENMCKRYISFFSIMGILNSYDNTVCEEKISHSDVAIAIEYINSYFRDPIRISDIAKRAGVSVNTLERHFHTTLCISPKEYLKKKRLANATRLLCGGATVTEASEQSGFSDYSNFISLFKSIYGVTPLKYKKNIAK